MATPKLGSTVRVVQAFSHEDRLALAVLATVSLIGCAGAVMGALLTEPPYRWYFVAIAIVTTLGGVWLGYYGIYGTHRLRLGLSETTTALAAAHELIDATGDSMVELETTVDRVAEVLSEEGHRIPGYRHPSDGW
jgi:hypothetical protein